MKDRFVVTIGREFGSGGRAIGIKLAELLGVNFYDRKLISKVAKRSGLCSKMLEREDEKVPSAWTHAFSFGYSPVVIQESIFKIQSEVIIDIARRESCVIVGRSANYVLRDMKKCMNIFITSPLERRIEVVMERSDVDRKESRNTIEKIDKSRAAYYSFYTDRNWRECSSYHLSIDSSILGIDGTAELIRDFVERVLK